MSTNSRYRVKAEKVHTLEDLRLEKMRLRLEIMKTEEKIHQGYRNLLDAFTFKNLAGTVINDVAASSSVMSKAFSFGTALLSKRKKKKHHKPPDDSGPEPL